MSQEPHWHRAHPLTLLHYFVNSVRQLFLLFFFVLFGAEETGYSLWMSFGLILVPTALAAIRYTTAKYAIDETNVYFHHGIFNRVRQTMRLDNIQNVGTEAPLVARLFGLRQVVISGASAEGTITIGLLDEAGSAQLIEATARGARQISPRPGAESGVVSTLPPPPNVDDRVPTSSTPAEPTAEQLESEPREELSLASPTNEQMFIGAAGATSGGGSGFAFWVLCFMIAITYMRLVDNEGPSWILLIGGPAAIYGIYRTMSTLTDLTNHWGFRLSVGKRSLGTRDGLFTEITKTAVRDRVQLVDIKSNTLMRYFKLVRISYDTADSTTDVASLSDRLLTPAIAADKAGDLIARVIETDVEVPSAINQVSPLTVRRGRFRWAVATALMGGIGLFATPMAGIPILAVMAMLTVWQPEKRYEYAGYQIIEPHLHVRFGVFDRHHLIIRLDKIQSLDISETYFQRRLGLATLHFGCGGRHRQISITDLPRAEAEQLAAELTRRSAATAFESTL